MSPMSAYSHVDVMSEQTPDMPSSSPINARWTRERWSSLYNEAFLQANGMLPNDNSTFTMPTSTHDTPVAAMPSTKTETTATQFWSALPEPSSNDNSEPHKKEVRERREKDRRDEKAALIGVLKEYLVANNSDFVKHSKLQQNDVLQLSMKYIKQRDHENRSYRAELAKLRCAYQRQALQMSDIVAIVYESAEHVGIAGDQRSALIYQFEGRLAAGRQWGKAGVPLNHSNTSPILRQSATVGTSVPRQPVVPPVTVPSFASPAATATVRSRWTTSTTAPPPSPTRQQPYPTNIMAMLKRFLRNNNSEPRPTAEPPQKNSMKSHAIKEEPLDESVKF